MKVSEIIEKLLKMDPNANFCYMQGFRFYPVRYLEQGHQDKESQFCIIDDPPVPGTEAVVYIDTDV